MRVPMPTAMLLLCTVALLAVAAGERVAMEPGVGGSVPTGWRLVGRAPPHEVLHLTVAVKQPAEGKAALEALLLAVSDPEHPAFGHHASRDALKALVAPSHDATAAVTAWLAAAGVAASDVSFNFYNDMVDVMLPVAVAEQLLHATYFEFQHVDAPHILVLRCVDGYSLPADVALHVDFVRPTAGFPAVQSRPQPLPAAAGVDTPDALVVDPKFLRELYGADKVFGNTSSSNKQAFASFLEQYFSPTDLSEFQRLFMNWTQPLNVSKVIGPNKGLPGTEANLDSQYIMGVGAGVTTWAYSTAGRATSNPDNEPFLVWLNNVNGEASPPNTISVSYGDDEKSVGYDYASRVNTELQKLGARGVSVMFASGDSGTGGNCTASNGRFNPNFPAGSPWVTAVGGLIGGKPGSFPTGEEADSISGGGFSDYWPRPAYQSAAVDGFFTVAANNSNMPSHKRYNHSGAGYPDIAAQSEGFLVVQFGLPLPVAGTSCASPTATAIFSLLNEQRVAAGKPPLGFLNPLIYSTAWKDAFSDAVKGVSFGCGGSGFPAVKGWDPVTGMGSPNYPRLAKLVAQLP